jgi:hypothetical protein
MGMHGAFLLAHCEWPDLRRAIESHCGPLADEGPVSEADWNRMPHDDVFHVTFHGERCYVLDKAMVLSGLPDTVVALSGQLSCEVIGAGAESVSGSFWLTAARNGRLALLHYDQKVAIAEPLHLGMHLPSEAAHPFDHPDGNGILAAIATLGFSVPVLMQGTPDGGTRYRWAASQFPQSGPVQGQIDQHCQTHKRPHADERLENVTVVRREHGGYDIRGCLPDGTPWQPEHPRPEPPART